MMLHLTAKEAEKVEKILLKMKAADHVLKGGFSRLLINWDKFVKECKQGYSSTIYDYRNDLDGRRIIQELLDRMGADKDFCKKVSVYLRPPDKQFRELLVNTDNCIWGEVNANEFPKKKFWWYWGIVKNATGELLNDLQFEDFNYYKAKAKK